MEEYFCWVVGSDEGIEFRASRGVAADSFGGVVEGLVAVMRIDDEAAFLSAIEIVVTGSNPVAVVVDEGAFKSEKF